MLNAQATQEIEAMESDLSTATTRSDLVQLHFDWMDCDPSESDTDDEVRATLADYIKEFRFSCASGQA